jgi:hypothetical protein
MADFYDKHPIYLPIFRLILVDPEQRLFTAERFRFRGRKMIGCLF